MDEDANDEVQIHHKIIPDKRLGETRNYDFSDPVQGSMISLSQLIVPFGANLLSDSMQSSASLTEYEHRREQH